MDYLQPALKGLVSGVLTAYLIIYGFRPAVPYPDAILEFFENKWVFLILLILNYYVFLWDARSGVLMLLCILALIFDYVIFTEEGIDIDITKEFNFVVDFFTNPQKKKKA